LTEELEQILPRENENNCIKYITDHYCSKHKYYASNRGTCFKLIVAPIPIYVHLANLIIPKSVVAEKYRAGAVQFRLDYHLPESEVNQEDDELFALGKMNADEFDIEGLMARGLHFDKDSGRSDDFCILCRHGGILWNNDLIRQNGVFAWHIDTPPTLLERMEAISNTSMDEIIRQMDLGNNLLRPIRQGDVGHTP
jgi:hypothetical protein